uniref:PPR_long domain-containing protein n=1 Tax=Parastrongyloides trichosuri TaxID=131310 RepID=A0A0N4ZQV9_PARTI
MNQLRLTNVVRSQLLPKAYIHYSSISYQEQVVKKEFIPNDKFKRRDKNTRNNNPLNIKFGDFNLVLKKTQTFEDEQKKLIYKHSDALTSEATTIFEFLDQIEYGLFSKAVTMQKMSEFLKDENFDGSLLSDRRISVIFKISGEYNYSCDSYYKDTYTDIYFDLLKKRNANFGIESMNTYFKTKFDNGNPVNVLEFYELLSKYELEPNVETFEILGDVISKKGDSKGVMELIKTMKEVNLPVSTPMFGSLIESLVLSNQIEKARSVMLSFENKRNIVNVQTLKYSFIYGLAGANKFDALVKSLQELEKETDYTNDENILPLYEMLFLFARSSNNVEQVKKIESIIPKLMFSGTMKYNESLGKYYVKCLDFIKEGNIGIASTLLNMLPDSLKANVENKIVRNFIKKVDTSNDGKAIVDEAKLLSEFDVIENPLIKSLNRLNGNDLNKFMEIFEGFKQSKEYETLKDRFFVIKIELTKMLQELTKTKKVDNQLEIIDRMLTQISNIDKINHGEFENRQISTIKWFICNNYLSKNIQLYDRLAKIEGNNYIFNITSQLINGCLYNKQFDTLKELLNVIKENRIRMLPYPRNIFLVKNILLNPKTPIDVASICSSILSLSYDQKLSNDRKNEIIDIVKNIILNKNINESSIAAMVEQWSNDGRIVFTKQQTANIIDELTSLGLVSRQKYIDSLLQKSNTTLRWLGTKDILRLEKELLYLEGNKDIPEEKNPSLYLRSIIVGKHLHESPVNFEAVLEHITKIYESDKKAVINKISSIPTFTMEKLISSNQYGFADELWNVKNIKLDTHASLLYAFSLYLRKENDKMLSVFNKIKNQAENVNNQTIKILSKHFPDTNENMIEGYAKILQQHFNISDDMTNKMYIPIYEKKFKELLQNNKLEEAFETCKKICTINLMPYGQIDLMSTSIKNNNSQLFGQVFNWVKDTHSKFAAFIDASIALLENDKVELAEKTFTSVPNLLISSSKLDFIITREISLNNVNVLKFVLKIISNNDKTTDDMLDKIIGAIINIYGTLKL